VAGEAVGVEKSTGPGVVTLGLSVNVNDGGYLVRENEVGFPPEVFSESEDGQAETKFRGR